MELWIPITIAAAFCQNLRFMLQKHLKATRLSTNGATFSRFVFAAPLAFLLAVLLTAGAGFSLPQANGSFIAFACIGGLAQICATSLVVALFAERNFTVGITFKKTEVLQAALFGMVVLAEFVSAKGFLAIFIGLAGVILLADPPKEKRPAKWHERLFNRAAIYGIGSGALFGLSGVAYRGASLSLGDHPFFVRSIVTLAFVTLFQTIVMAIYLKFREPGEVSRVLASWRVSSLVGLTGMLGSLGWFTAFTLQNAAYVKALGQIELVFTFLASYFVFKERSSPRELLAIALIVLSILILILLI